MYDHCAATESRIPRYGQALLQGLQIEGSRNSHTARLLDSLDGREWQSLIRCLDSSQLTLLFFNLNQHHIPTWLAARIEIDANKHRRRFERLLNHLRDISKVLASREIPFAVLKGFTHAPDFIENPLLRAQGDLDLWCEHLRVEEAAQALERIRFRPIGRSKGRHLTPMIRESGWTWTGDYFAPELPIPVELHYELWDAEHEGLPALDEKAIWSRLSPCNLSSDINLLQLCDPDKLAFASLHFLMHLLHGDTKLLRGWELAYFLDNRQDPAFWHTWRSLYSPKLRQLQMTTFVLAARWFGCQLPSAVIDEVDDLPQLVRIWLHNYSLSPVASLFNPNKDELWLHMALLSSFKDKARIFARRLLPFQAVEIKQTVNERPTRSMLRHIWRRLFHHALTLLPTCARAVRWWWRTQGSSAFLGSLPAVIANRHFSLKRKL
jgi:hypothetical protein